MSFFFGEKQLFLEQPAAQTGLKTCEECRIPLLLILPLFIMYNRSMSINFKKLNFNCQPYCSWALLSWVAINLTFCNLT